MPSIKRGIFFILIIFLQQTSGNSQDTCQPKSELGRIKKQALCGYDKTVRPVLSLSQTTNLTLHMYLRSIDFDEEKHILRVFAWLTMKWTDDILQWPSQTDEKYIPFTSEEIWTPDLILVSSTYDRGQMSGRNPGLPRSMCWYQEQQTMNCAPLIVFEAHCAANLTRWPLDEQFCSIDIGSWTEKAKGIRIFVYGDGFTQLGNLRKKWALTNATVSQPHRNETYDYIRFSFKMQRHSGAHLATVVIPAFVLSLLTLLTLFLEAGCPERITLGCTNALAHCLYLQYLGLKLPPNGDSVPAIVAFFRDSLFLAGASLALAVSVRGLTSARTRAPQWLSSVISTLLSTAPGRFLLQSQLSSTSVAVAAKPVEASDEPGPAEDCAWQHAALLLDRIGLALFPVALTALFLTYVP